MDSVKNEWVNLEQYLEDLNQIDAGQITIYHQRAWIEAVSAGFNCTFKYLRSFDSSGTLALTPFMHKKKGPFSLLGSPLSGMYTEFAGPIFSNEIDHLSRKSIIVSQGRYISVGQHYIEWGIKGSFDAETHWGRVLEEQDYTSISRRSLFIDLSIGPDAVWSGFKSRARNMIRKSEKADLVANTISPDEAWIEEYYNLLKQTFERQGLSVPHPLSFYRQIISLSQSGLALCVDVLIAGKISAGAIFLIDGHRMMYFSGVADREGMRLAAPSLIQWHAIQSAISKEIIGYDMGGLGVESIDKFKRSFGGSEVQHSRWVYRSKLFNLIEPLGRWLARKGVIGLGGS